MNAKTRAMDAFINATEQAVKAGFSLSSLEGVLRVVKRDHDEANDKLRKPWSLTEEKDGTVGVKKQELCSCCEPPCLKSTHELPTTSNV